MKTRTVTEFLRIIHDPTAEASARVAAAGTILETILEEQLAEVKQRIVALEAKRQKKQKRSPL